MANDKKMSNSEILDILTGRLEVKERVLDIVNMLEAHKLITYFPITCTICNTVITNILSGTLKRHFVENHEKEFVWAILKGGEGDDGQSNI